MLVQFSLKNFLSFKNKAVLDLTAVQAYKEHEENLIDYGKEKLLRVVSVYGANASGKSNLYFAMWFFQRIIRESLNNVEDDAVAAIEKYYVPFEFEDEPHGNTEFEVIGIADDFEYRYGFEYNSKCIVTEWMYRKNLRTGRTVTILERTEDTVMFGASVRKECDIYKGQIPAETLALSFFNKLKLKTEVFKDFYSSIMRTLVVPTDFLEDKELLEGILPNTIKHDKDQLLKFLNAIDSEIVDIDYDNSEKKIMFFTYHMGENGKKYLLSLYNESDGTVKSIMLFMYAKMAVANNLSLFVDELNIKLHPLLLKFIIDLFYDKDSEAQLIYTTHDTTLMDKRFFRRDQILFVQKDEHGHSELTALSDFRVRSDASFEKDYLAGVYGGIPFLKEFGWKESV